MYLQLTRRGCMKKRVYEKDIKKSGVLSLCWCGTNNTERCKSRKYVIAELCIWETILNVMFPKSWYFTLTYLQLTGRVYGNDIKQFGVWGLVGAGVQINREVQVKRVLNCCIRVHDCCFKFLRKNS